MNACPRPTARQTTREIKKIGEIRETERVTILKDPDGSKWTAWSVSRCRDRELGETGGGLPSGDEERSRNGQELALRTALMDGPERGMGMK